jgi:uncharacterized RDD family membrane protein YckC
MNSSQLVLAPIGKRFSAQFIDEALAFIMGYIVLLLLSKVLPSDSTIPMVAMWLIFIGYTLMADGMFNGQSIGKKFMGLYVIDAKTNEPCTYAKSVLRNVTYILGVIDWIFIIGKERRRLGDRLASTRVMMAT